MSRIVWGSLHDTVLLPVLQEYQTFAEQHPGVLESVGVSQDNALTKARLLALLSLASRSHELSYAHIRVRAAPLAHPCMHYISPTLACMPPCGCAASSQGPCNPTLTGQAECAV